MLRAIMRAIRRVLTALGRGIARTLGAVFGGGRPHLPSPEFEELVDDEAEELRQELDAAAEGPVPAASTLGQRIHAYAAADVGGRAGFDFDGVPDDVALTLLSLSGGQLSRLAAAGPRGCGRWALGEKTGLVGVPACRSTPPAAPVAGDYPSETAGFERAPEPRSLAA